MASISRSIPFQTTVKTENGACTVKIELEINVNLNKDEISVPQKVEKVVEKCEGKTLDTWAIPDFDSTELFEFGKIEEQK